MSAPLVLDAAAVAAACPPADAVVAIRSALTRGLDPAADLPRQAVPLDAGQLLLMPSDGGGDLAHVGIKLATVAPANPDLGLPRIQGSYLLLDAATLGVVAMLDGITLTTLRTPAVSVAAVLDRLLAKPGPAPGPGPDLDPGAEAGPKPGLAPGPAPGPEAGPAPGQEPLLDPLGVAVIGSGPQAHGHVATLADVLRGRRELAPVTQLVRNPGRVTPIDGAQIVRLGSEESDAALRTADVVVCATSAREPLFDAALIADTAIVIAVGSHEPDARELPAGLLARATVVVEDPGAALREAGDVVLAIADGALRTQDLVPMRDVVTGAVHPDPARPLVFKSTGMSWEDLVVAEEVLAGARLH
ncbi:ornithine cyclodeaminase [Promicromonospora sp. AC04]|uniref:ornithine cyclodeaminase family protein n=1 Tax=Promicromonospora sp. AC04 TaxID=2135723 RepID=UPI000D358020|nr:ornithine cyclodeaminase [Promicromonospora sp. AC04]PUB31888.1 ornithine cyclodeaminase [Promicromonospora sp. AC04]